MTNSQIDFFLAVAKNLSFSKAAKELYTTQPTVSRQIQMLEKEWGILLFERNTKEVKLTPAGMYMQKECIKSNEKLKAKIEKAKSIQ